MIPMISRRSMAVLAGAASLSVALAGCGVLPARKPPPQLYTLTPKSTFPDDLPYADWQLGIDSPSAPAGLSTTRIAVARQPLTLDYYAGAQWIDEAPSMVQRLLIESFENSGKIVGVGRESVGLRSNFVLRMELREFQAEYFDGATLPTVRVRLSAKLVKVPQRHIIASTTEERVIVAADNRMETIIRTFDDALGRALRGIVVWTLTRPETQG
ncbi:MAG: membrane integrity-associated transporter subunit PqiC [Alphaproteobacteria bacterium]|nr:membrane integrity-associated transporter subunit PqiC [Alphaproteobacteria bacterium]